MDTVNSQIVKNVGDFAPVIQVESLREVARRYREAGLNVLPATRAGKHPIGKWKDWTKTVGDFDQIFPVGLQFDALAVVCGATSGGLEVVDFDQKAKAFEAFKAAFGSLDGFPVESTQSEGKHIAFRSDCYERNLKLASDENGVLIETRGQGGICIIAPSDGYEPEAGDWLDVPKLDADKRARLIAAARSLDRSKATATATPPTKRTATASKLPVLQGEETPADYLRNNLDIVRDALARAGWEFEGKGVYDGLACEYWSRPNQSVEGKPGGSLGLEGGLLGNFHCFTSNAPGFDLDGNYSPLHVVARLEFGGDESAAARDIWRRYMGSSRKPRVIDCINKDELATPCNKITISNATPNNEQTAIEARIEREREKREFDDQIAMLSTIGDYPRDAVFETFSSYANEVARFFNVDVSTPCEMGLTNFGALIAPLFPLVCPEIGYDVDNPLTANLALATIGESATGKTPVFNKMFVPINRIQERVGKEAQARATAYRKALDDQKFAEKQIKRLESKLKRVDGDEKEKLLEELKKLDAVAEARIEAPAGARDVFFNPTTPEGSRNALRANVLRGYRNGGLAATDEGVALFTSTYNANGAITNDAVYSRFYEYATNNDKLAGSNKDRYEDIEDCGEAVKLVCGFNVAIQPSVLLNCFKSKAKLEQGFLQRFNFCYIPVNDKELDELPAAIDETTKERYCRLFDLAFESCLLSETLATQNPNEQAETLKSTKTLAPCPVTLDVEAIEIFAQFKYRYAQRQKGIMRGEGRGSMVAYYSKLPTIALKYAIIYRVALALSSGRYDSVSNGVKTLVVDAPTMRDAVRLATAGGLRREATELTILALKDREGKDGRGWSPQTRKIFDLLLSKPEEVWAKTDITKIFRNFAEKKDARKFELAIKPLLDGGFIRRAPKKLANRTVDGFQYVAIVDNEETEGRE